MYLPHDEWSQSEEGDPPPCLRQGDLVQVTWVRPDTSPSDGGKSLRMTLEIRPSEIVALVGACCDLVLRDPPKRKGFLIAPLKPIPKHIAQRPQAMSSLKATVAEAVERREELFPNLVYFGATRSPEGFDVPEGVIYLEALAMIEAPLLRAAVKLAELPPNARGDLRERIKHHFTRGAL